MPGKNTFIPLINTPTLAMCVMAPLVAVTGMVYYAADRIFLRKVGGGHIFTHRMLMEYFATLGTDPSADSSE